MGQWISSKRLISCAGLSAQLMNDYKKQQLASI
jgi:hypothetical protein